MKRLTLFQWATALMLAIVVAASTASAQEADTITISSTFSPFGLDDTVGPDLAEVYANGHDHTWTLTLHGTTYSHSRSGTFYITDIHATSFDLEFFGPDAATLNGIVSEHIAEGDVMIELWNHGGFAIWQVWVFGPDVEFWTGELSSGCNTPFPADADGFPVVGPDPLSVWAENSIITDNRHGNSGSMWAWDSFVTFAGSVGEPDPGESVALSVADAAVIEGHRGTSNVPVKVTLSQSSDAEVTVHYSTVDGTAFAKSDYNATSGTLTFQPGQTSKTISVAIKGDRKSEADETFLVQLSDVAGATIGDGVATVTILNDD